jgi:signal transduction histidine kinase/response regulator of citrate/malate metabolism
MRILLIDACRDYREHFAALLAESDVGESELDWADNAADGARLMNRGEHGLYFVAYRLPQECGLNLIKQARMAGVDRPIICLTGHDNPELDYEAEQAGTNLNLPKSGLSAPVLHATIFYALRQAADLPMPRDAQMRFHLAQEATNFGAWEWDLVRDEMAWDARMFQLHGCLQGEASAEEVWARTVHPATRAAIAEAMRTSIETNTPFQTDFRVTWADDTVHYIRSAGRVSRAADGSALRLTGVNWDITELRRLVADLAQARDEAERANKAKSRFLAGISHELRTPLNGVLGYAHLLRMEGGLTLEQDARVDSMLRAGAHLLDMINRVLDFSAIEAEHLELRPASIDPRAILAASLELVRPAADRKALALILRVAPDAPRLVTTDPTRLRQIVLNLLGNAVKFTAAGSVVLSMRPAREANWRIEVTDTGPGIPAAQRDRLFKDFERFNDDHSHSIEGAGLGLALSARLASLLGGTLGHRDNPEGGSIFWLELPLAPATRPDPPAEPKPATDSAALAPEAAAHGCRILVVDDVEMNLTIARAFLSKAGHQVTCVESGPDAIEAVAAGQFDIVLMDVRMPGMDGLEATRRIRALPAPNGAVPIVGLSAQAFVDQVEECLEAGMNGHLSKPYDPKSLYAAVERARLG